MAGYIINGDPSYDSIPVTEYIGQTPDYSTCAYIEKDVEIPTSGEITLWSGQGGYVKSTGSIGGGFYGIQGKRLNGSTTSGTITRSTTAEGAEGLKSFICAPVTGTDESTAIIKVYWILAYNFADIDFSQLTTDNVLYENTWVNAKNQGGFIGEEREWDESPTEDINDPDNLLPKGGEFADLGAWNENDLMLIEDMPDPTEKMPNYHGLVTCYSFHGGELERIANALFLPSFWTSLTDKFTGLSDPLSMILDCYELPISKGTGSTTFKLGGINVPDPTTGQPFGVSKQQVRYRKVSMGDVVLKEVWGSAKDYTDCSISIFLPYCGVKELDPDIVIQSRLTLYAYIDSWNGDILYLIHASNYGRDNKYFRQDNVVYRFTGNCGKKIPLGRVDTSNQILQAVSGIASIGMGFASGGLSGAAAMAAPVAGNLLNGGFRPAVQTSGGITGNAGRCDYQYAYLIIKRGVPEYPNNWRAEIGAPRNQTFQLSALLNTGYTLFSHIQLGNMGDATEEEKAELERLLTTEGIIL